jgi:hypothetical protein
VARVGLLPGIRGRGQDAAGLGYLSGLDLVPDGPDPLKPAEYVPTSGISRMPYGAPARILES